MCLQSLKCTPRPNGDVGDLRSTSFAMLPVGWSSNHRRFLFDTKFHPRFTSLLFDCGKRNVTLYVGHNNSAQRVYDRVGFVGLCGKEKVNGVEDSLELGLVTGAPRGQW